MNCQEEKKGAVILPEGPCWVLDLLVQEPNPPPPTDVGGQLGTLLDGLLTETIF